MSQPEMMNYGVANQTSELPLALHHTRTCVLLDRPCTETKQANEGPVGLWIRRLYQGFNIELFIPLGANFIHFAAVTHLHNAFNKVWEKQVFIYYSASLPAYVRT